MVWYNQIETLFQYRINCVIGRCRGISKPRDLYTFLSIWNLACRSAPTCLISEQYDIWNTQSRGFKSDKEELAYAVMFDIAYVWMLNGSVNISSGKYEYTSFIVTYRTLNTHFETKFEKAKSDLVSDQVEISAVSYGKKINRFHDSFQAQYGRRTRCRVNTIRDCLNSPFSASAILIDLNCAWS